MGEEVEATVMNSALLAAAQRAEHYEIASYGCVRNWATELRID
jgi:ferritin-like metal-binding protein YciE